MKKVNTRKSFKDFSKEETAAFVCGKYPLIKNCFVKKGLSRFDREDLTQETASLVYQHIHTVKEPCKADAWVREIAKNKYLKFLQDERKRMAALDTSRPVEEITIAEDEQGAVCGRIEKMESQESLWILIKTLGEPDVTVFTMYYVDDHKLVEIAKLQEMNLNTVKSIHARGLKKLKKLLESQKYDLQY